MEGDELKVTFCTCISGNDSVQNNRQNMERVGLGEKVEEDLRAQMKLGQNGFKLGCRSK